MLRKVISILIPKSLLNKLNYVRNTYFLNGFAIKSYSQEGEDMILRNLFQKQKTGFYIDIGAYHPKLFSNTYFFYRLGWCGINIDAMPNSMKLFNRIRPRDINIEQSISDKEQTLTYYAFESSAYNGFSRDLSEHRAGEGISLKFSKDLKTERLETVLDRYLPLNQEIDFLSIDIEGFEYMALKSCNLEKYKPKIILIEMLKINLSEIEDNKIVKYLKKYGYSIYAKSIHSVFFIQNNHYCTTNMRLRDSHDVIAR